MKWERVFTINDYYDGPRLGVAEVRGIPHLYEAEFDHSTDEYGNTYFVSPIDGDLLALVLEDWDIWLRWHSAHQLGHALQETHPALPEDRARHEVLKQLIGNSLRVDPTNAKRKKAEFRNLRTNRSWTGTEVCWTDADI